MATQADKILSFANSKLGSHNYDDYCQRFVRECYQAGGIYGQASSAAEAWKKWGKSSGRDIPVCAAVYFDGTGAGAVYGHVGLYAGDGYVIHAWSGVRREKLDDIERRVAYRGWGYQGGVAPIGAVSYPLAQGVGAESPALTPGESSPNQKYDPSAELSMLKKFLSRFDAAPNGDVIEAAAERAAETPELKIRVIINGDKPTATEIPVHDDLQVIYERVGTPGKLTFKTFIDAENPIEEGDRVSVRVDGNILFVGYVFTRQRNKDETVSITAYNQIRYLKNKDTRVYTNMSASDLLKAIARDYKLETDVIDETGFKMSRVEDDATLMDILLNALDETFTSTGELYTLYDKEGKLSLKNIKNMRVDSCVVCNETAQDYTYKTSIDADVYNQVKLIYDNGETGSYDAYITKDSGNIEKWGVLQYFEKIKHPALGPIKSEVLLKAHNRIARNLTLEGVIGSSDVMAGCLIPIVLDLGDLEVKNFMLVEKVTHRINNNEYFMDIIVTGGDFIV